MTFSTSSSEEPGKRVGGTVPAIWIKRLVISLTFLIWLILVMVIARLLGYISTALLILVMAALVAYAVVPLVEFFQRVMPRPFAILLVYLVILGVLALLFYLLVVTSVAQIAALAASASTYFMPHNGQVSPIMQILQKIGVTQAQIGALSNAIGGQLAGIAADVAKNLLPLISGIAGGLLNLVLTAVISIYLIVDGKRIVRWVRKNAPLPAQTGTRRLLDILQHVVGGYIRGQFVLCALVGFLVGIGMFILRVPYAILLGTLGGFLEFIPVIGTITSGIICCLIALTQGWLTFFLVLIYFVVLHVFEGYILAPRVVGKAVGLHPIVSLLALAAGGELFGPLGAILAAPVAGLIQSVLVAFWLYYRGLHKEQFAEDMQAP